MERAYGYLRVSGKSQINGDGLKTLVKESGLTPERLIVGWSRSALDQPIGYAAILGELSAHTARQMKPSAATLGEMPPPTATIGEFRAMQEALREARETIQHLQEETRTTQEKLRRLEEMVCAEGS